MTDILERLNRNVETGTYILPVSDIRAARDEIVRLRAAAAKVCRKYPPGQMQALFNAMKELAALLPEGERDDG